MKGRAKPWKETQVLKDNIRLLDQTLPEANLSLGILGTPVGKFFILSHCDLGI